MATTYGIPFYADGTVFETFTDCYSSSTDIYETIKFSKQIGDRKYAHQIRINPTSMAMRQHVIDYHYQYFSQQAESYTTASLSSIGSTSGTIITGTIEGTSSAYCDYDYIDVSAIGDPNPAYIQVERSDYYGTQLPNDQDWSVIPNGGEWSAVDFWREKTAIEKHHESMQAKIEREWRLWCRNENHTENMQLRIRADWSHHLANERVQLKRESREAAETKANELLGLIIGPKQLKVYQQTGRMFVKGKHGLYIVKRGGGISRINGKNITDFCIHIKHDMNCPPTDHAITLKFMLEENDKKVIRIANRMTQRTVDALPLAACM